jgi:hypothetical protein
VVRGGENTKTKKEKQKEALKEEGYRDLEGAALRLLPLPARHPPLPPTPR